MGQGSDSRGARPSLYRPCRGSSYTPTILRTTNTGTTCKSSRAVESVNAEASTCSLRRLIFVPA